MRVLPYIKLQITEFKDGSFLEEWVNRETGEVICERYNPPLEEEED